MAKGAWNTLKTNDLLNLRNKRTPGPMQTASVAVVLPSTIADGRKFRGADGLIYTQWGYDIVVEPLRQNRRKVRTVAGAADTNEPTQS